MNIDFKYFHFFKKKNLFLHIVDNTSINLVKLLNQQNGGDRQKAQYMPTWRLPVEQNMIATK